LIMVDIGSSTGGFTDCALQHGVKEVYAIDVGTNQLDWKIRSNPCVHVFEQTNFRYVDSSLFIYGQPEFASIDVSFISLKHIFPPLSSILKPNAYIVALIKPQFEAGKDEVGKHGLIHDKNIHCKVIHQVIAYAKENHMAIKNLTYSPITGGSGNIEFLGLFKNTNELD
ncbi:MAG: TlyA family RNA methyltransferase, partial [Erysipelotrichaceae bacterium]|nr:TlyA family RNA methyltransferase [Erysipelotrichaceae bacterium]